MARIGNKKGMDAAYVQYRETVAAQNLSGAILLGAFLGVLVSHTSVVPLLTGFTIGVCLAKKIPNHLRFVDVMLEYTTQLLTQSIKVFYSSHTGCQ